MATPATARTTATAVLLVLYMVPQVMCMGRYSPRQAVASGCQLLSMTSWMTEVAVTLVLEPG